MPTTQQQLFKCFLALARWKNLQKLVYVQATRKLWKSLNFSYFSIWLFFIYPHVRPSITCLCHVTHFQFPTKIDYARKYAIKVILCISGTSYILQARLHHLNPLHATSTCGTTGNHNSNKFRSPKSGYHFLPVFCANST